MLRLLLLLSFLSSFIAIAQKDAEKKYLKAEESRMVYLDSGIVLLGYADQDVVMPPVVSARQEKFNVGPFYIGAYEVSNLDYLEYLYSLRNTNMDAYTTALPDTTVWIKGEGFGNKYLDYYLRHPAYNHYPVVGVTHQQAERYCEWLTERYNENPDRKHKKVRFRLPTKNEWMYAAFSGANYEEPKKGKTTSTLYTADIFLFPWPQKASAGYDHAMLNDQGEPLANFKLIDQSSVQYVDGTLIHQNDTITEGFYISMPGYVNFGPAMLKEDSDYSAPVYSFLPGLSGLYNMAGNVEEMVAEYGITKGGSWNDTGYYLQNTTEETYDSSTETTPYRGFRLAMDVLEEF
ncbi:MAG: SUMF1/EgtB/PvdO family nonheme iron enzyme [Fluviicola sp.]|nr:SUMF1/EgtB/PvdO family nonheme iron enzyme [Fluviicola sp.]